MNQDLVEKGSTPQDGRSTQQTSPNSKVLSF